MKIKPLLIFAVVCLVEYASADTALPPEVFKQIQTHSNIEAGDIVYVDFWASWCTPCRKSFPWMNEMQEKYGDRGLRVIAVNVDQERALADKFLNDVPINFTVIFDKEGRLAKSFKVKGMPSSYLIDSAGNIKVAHKGFFEKNIEQYEEELSSLLLPARKEK